MLDDLKKIVSWGGVVAGAIFLIFYLRPDVATDESEAVDAEVIPVVKNPNEIKKKNDENKIVSIQTNTNSKPIIGNSEPDSQANPDLPYVPENNLNSYQPNEYVVASSQLSNTSDLPIIDDKKIQIPLKPNSENTKKYFDEYLGGSILGGGNKKTEENPASEITYPKEILIPSNNAQTISVVADKYAGTYSDAIDVNLIFRVNGVPSNAGSIYYCLRYGGACCDESEVTNVYSTPIHIGDGGDGAYCLIFKGKGIGNLETSIASLNVTINKFSDPETTVSETQYLQTTQKFSFKFPEINYIDDPKDINLMFYHLAVDPGLNPNCLEIAANNFPIDLSGDGQPDQIDFEEYLGLPTKDILGFSYISPIHYPLNYIATMLTKNFTGGVEYRCQVLPYIFNDFEMFEFSSTKNHFPANDDASYGNFTPFGFFQDSGGAGEESGTGQSDELHYGVMNSMF